MPGSAQPVASTRSPSSTARVAYAGDDEATARRAAGADAHGFDPRRPHRDARLQRRPRPLRLLGQPPHGRLGVVCLTTTPRLTGERDVRSRRLSWQGLAAGGSAASKGWPLFVTINKHASTASCGPSDLDFVLAPAVRHRPSTGALFQQSRGLRGPRASHARRCRPDGFVRGRLHPSRSWRAHSSRLSAPVHRPARAQSSRRGWPRSASPRCSSSTSCPIVFEDLARKGRRFFTARVRLVAVRLSLGNTAHLITSDWQGGDPGAGCASTAVKYFHDSWARISRLASLAWAL